MKTKGVRVDLNKAEQVKKELTKLEKSLVEEIASETKVTIEPWVATSVAKVFDAMGLAYSRTEKSGSPRLQNSFLLIILIPLRKRL